MKIITTAALAVFLFCSCQNNRSGNGTNADSTANSMALDHDTTINVDSQKVKLSWDYVAFASPEVKYDEILLPNIKVHGNDSTSMFSINDNVLFGFDKSELRDSGKQALDQIAASIKKRYPNGAIGIYGYTDSIGTKNYNKELSQERANAVKTYLQKQTNIDMSRINTYARGESNPTATNATPSGRQENRRVDIVAQKYHSP